MMKDRIRGWFIAAVVMLGLVLMAAQARALDLFWWLRR
jgi:hypothetical protein